MVMLFDKRNRKIAYRYAFPLAAILLLCLSVPHVLPSVRAANGGGHPGEFTLIEHQCGRHGCSKIGTFRSDDGTVVRTRVKLRAPVPRSAGQGHRTRARDTGDPNSVYKESGSRDWMIISLLAGIPVLFLLGWLVWVIRLSWTVARDLRENPMVRRQ